MVSSSLQIEDNDELLSRVRAETSYDDDPDELPDEQLSSIIETAKLHVAVKTGAEDWYSSPALSLVLLAYSCMRAKSAVENIPLQSYTLGDETVSFDTDDPDASVQLQQWAEDINVGMAEYDAGSDDARVPTNTAGYIGETSMPGDADKYDRY